MSQTVERRRKAKDGFVRWKTGDQGERIPYVPCTDGCIHRYLTADYVDLDRTPPQSVEDKPAACPACGMAMSELRGDTVKRCSECLWDAIAEHIQTFQAESGTQLMATPPDQVLLRSRNGGALDKFRRRESRTKDDTNYAN
jgi:hypothetical protein